MDGLTSDGVWRVVYPIRNDGPIYTPAIFANTSLVVATLVANHATGYWVRVRMRSPVDYSYFFSDRFWVPFFPPTVLEVYPTGVPKAGAVINILGHSMGTGGRVIIRQRAALLSAAALSDGSLTQLYPFVTPLGVDGSALGNASDAQALSSAHVDIECLLLAWDQSRVRCLAPPGFDPAAVVIVDNGLQVGNYTQLAYYDALPCTYTFKYDAPNIDLYYPTFFEEYELGVWSGLVFGIGLWIAAALLVSKIANRDARIIFRPSDMFIKVLPSAKKAAGEAADKQTVLRYQHACVRCSWRHRQSP